MDAGTTLTFSGLISLTITSAAAFYLHKKVVDHVEAVLKRIELGRQERENRLKAQIVSQLFSLWFRSGTVSLTADEKMKLNQLSFECALWLPPNILHDISLRLTNAANAKDAKVILIEVRNYLSQNDDGVDPNIIVHY